MDNSNHKAQDLTVTENSKSVGDFSIKKSKNQKKKNKIESSGINVVLNEVQNIDDGEKKENNNIELEPKKDNSAISKIVVSSYSNKTSPSDKNETENGKKAKHKFSSRKIKATASPDDKLDKNEKPKKKHNLWWIKIAIISLFISAFISFISEMTASSEHIIVTLMLLLFLILASILFDGIGVAAASCDITPIRSMASKKIYGAKTALWLVKNNEKVANVCNDVIGDIFGIISGACTAAIVVKIVVVAGEAWQKGLTIIMSSIVASLTIGGKAFLKELAISNSKEFIMFVARILAVFSPEERKRKKAAEIKRKKRIEEQARLNNIENSDKEQTPQTKDNKNN